MAIAGDHLSDTESLHRIVALSLLLRRAIFRRRLPSSQQERWQTLRQKLEAETLTEREHQELLTYSDLLEAWNAERVEAMAQRHSARSIAQLATLRRVEFDTLYQELPPQDMGV